MSTLSHVELSWNYMKNFLKLIKMIDNCCVSTLSNTCTIQQATHRFASTVVKPRLQTTQSGILNMRPVRTRSQWNGKKTRRNSAKKIFLLYISEFCSLSYLCSLPAWFPGIGKGRYNKIGIG